MKSPLKLKNNMNKPQLFYFFTPNTYWKHVANWEETYDGKFYRWINGKIPSEKYQSVSIINSNKSSTINISVLKSEYSLDDLKKIDFSEFFGTDFKNLSCEYFEKTQTHQKLWHLKMEVDAAQKLIGGTEVKKSQKTEYGETFKYAEFDFEVVAMTIQLKPKYNSYKK